MAVELGEEAAEVHDPEGEHPGLVPVIARSPVAFLEGSRERQLGDLLAVAEYSEFGLSGKHLSAPRDGRAAGGIGKSIVAYDFRRR